MEKELIIRIPEKKPMCIEKDFQEITIHRRNAEKILGNCSVRHKNHQGPTGNKPNTIKILAYETIAPYVES